MSDATQALRYLCGLTDVLPADVEGPVNRFKNMLDLQRTITQQANETLGEFAYRVACISKAVFGPHQAEEQSVLQQAVYFVCGLRDPRLSAAVEREGPTSLEEALLVACRLEEEVCRSTEPSPVLPKPLQPSGDTLTDTNCPPGA